MAHIGLLLGAILVATASWSGTAAAQERQLGSDGDVKFSIPTQYRCETTAPVTVAAPDESLFIQDQVRLQRLLGLIRLALGFECPTVSIIEVSGVVRGRQVYSGMATAADNWRLASTQDARKDRAAFAAERDAERNKVDPCAGLPNPADEFRCLFAKPRKKQADPIYGQVAPALPGASPTEQAEPTTTPAIEDAWTAAAASKDYAALASEYGLHTARGLPVVAASRSILTDDQVNAATGLFDFVELALDPGLIDTNPRCWGTTYLPKAVADEYLRSSSSWKGENEFERERSKQAFLADHRAGLMARAVSPPLEVQVIDEWQLPPYDADAVGFQLPLGDLKLHGATFDVFQHYYGVSSMHPPCANRELAYSPAAAALPEFWAIDAARAEELVKRLNERKAYLAFTLRLREMPLAKTENPNRPSDRVPLWSEILSVGIYEDPDLERPIETLAFPKAVEPILLSGVPDSPRFPEIATIDEETLALILVRDHGDVLDAEAWRLLMQRQAAHDEAYYQRKKEAVHWLEARETYAEDHIPFFPNGFSADFRSQFPEAMTALFKEWATLRALNLPDNMILQTRISQRRGDPATLDLPIAQERDSSGVVAALLEKGYSVNQLLRPDQYRSTANSRFDDGYLGGNDVSRKPVVVLPNIASSYIPAFTDADAQRLIERGERGGEVEILLEIGSTEIVPIDSKLQAFVLAGSPTMFRSTSRDSDEVIYEHRYDLAASLDPNRLDVATPPVAPPAGEALALSAEAMDLLTVKHLRDVVTDEDYRQMMMARWAYEASLPPGKGEPDWGRFFVPGRPQPDAAQQGEMLPRFKSWTTERAEALPERIRLKYDSVRVQEAIPVPVFTAGIYRLGNLDGNLVNSQIDSCTLNSKNHSALRPACDFLQQVYENTPAIYPFGVGDEMAGPRLRCRAALGSGQKEVYCDARQAQFDKVSSAQFEPGFREVMILDKEVFFPGTPTEVASLPSGVGMVVDVAVQGARVADKPLPIPMVEAFKRYEEFRKALGLSGSGRSGENDEAPSGKYLLFDAAVLSARLVQSRTEEPIRDLELRPARTPDLDALTLPAPATAGLGEPHGPDIVGLQLGMTLGEADAIIRSHMTVGRVLLRDRARQSGAVSGDFERYSSSRIYVADDDNEFIILYDDPPSAEGIVVGITRQINFPLGQMTAAAALAQLRSKYGKEDWSGRNGSVGWGAGLAETTINDSISHQCIPGTGNRAARDWMEEDGTPTEWKPASKHAVPNLQLYSDVRARNCGPILSMQFDAMNSPTAADRLILQLTDPSHYGKLYEESKRRVKSGEASIGAEAAAPGMKL